MARPDLVDREGRIERHRTDPGPMIGDLQLRRGESDAAQSPNSTRDSQLTEHVFHGPEEELPQSFQTSEVEQKAVDNFLTSKSKEILGEYSLSSGGLPRETVTIYASKGEIVQVGIIKI